MSDAIDRYLDELLGTLRGSPRDVRRVLTEAEQHLREAASSHKRAGHASESAQLQAIEQFGSARDIARAFNRTWLPMLQRLLLTAQALAIVASIGLVAIGISGLLSSFLGTSFGRSFVVDADGPTNATGWPREVQVRCQRYLAQYPEALTCRRASLAHHFDDVVHTRFKAGLAGVAALGAFAMVYRFNRRRRADITILPRPSLTVVVAVLAALTVWRLGYVVLYLIGGSEWHGLGVYLSDGIVAFTACLAFSSLLVRTHLLRDRKVQALL